ncbi:RNase P subunit p30 family protein [Methanocrinis sp.]|uniref:RNase P subunit p30 family protein n=1 Tax=Methanocrinis sp. TaxID=3101522 RepID=UPI003D0A1531
MNYYECNLHALPDGSDSPSRMALAAKRLGYSGIVITNHTAAGRPFGFDAAKLVRGIEVVMGSEIVATSQRALHARAASLREGSDFIAVHGGDEKINRAACEDPNVDLLAHPHQGRAGIGVAAAKAARDNQVAICLALSPMIRLRGTSRIRWMEAVKRDLDLVRKFDLNLMISTGARSHLDLRSPRDLVALTALLGLERERTVEALALPGSIIDLNRRRWASVGVEVL